MKRYKIAIPQKNKSLMFLRRVYPPVISSILLLFSLNTFSQEASANFNKASTAQIINYKPKKAKAGKNGSQRIAMIQLFKGPKNGKNGKEGSIGLNLKVNISGFKIGDTSILQLFVTEISKDKKTDTFYVNPRYGHIKLIVDGGDGGDGGQGETGGGSPGSGGKGGTGGQAEVSFDSSALSYANCQCLLFSNEGGIGGWSGENYGKAGEPGKKGSPIYFKEQNGKIIFIR